MELVNMVFKYGEDDYMLWIPEIPADDELLVKLLEKYENSGSSVRGTFEEIKNELV